MRRRKRANPYERVAALICLFLIVLMIDFNFFAAILMIIAVAVFWYFIKPVETIKNNQSSNAGDVKDLPAENNEEYFDEKDVNEYFSEVNESDVKEFLAETNDEYFDEEDAKEYFSTVNESDDVINIKKKNFFNVFGDVETSNNQETYEDVFHEDDQEVTDQTIDHDETLEIKDTLS